MVDISKNETCRYKEMSCHMFVVQHVEQRRVRKTTLKANQSRMSNLIIPLLLSTFFDWIIHFLSIFLIQNTLEVYLVEMTLNIHDYKFGVLFFSNNFLITGGFSIGAPWCVHWEVDWWMCCFLLKIPYVARKCFTCTKKYDFV